jgi:two-component sensor histidine kinase
VAGGRGPGFFAAILSWLSQWGLFIPTSHTLAVLTYMFDASVCVMLIVIISQTLEMLQSSLERERLGKQQQQLLAQELHHRIQNLFTVIQAVVRFSLPGDRLVDEVSVKRRLTDRLQSMSVTHRAITDSIGSGVCLADILNTEVSTFENRFETTGPLDLFLTPRMAQNLALIIHELVTNALKYGAWSAPHGRVILRIDWTAPVLFFTWQECDGPAVRAPSTSGFGSQILDVFARRFCSKVDMSYASNGFRYALEIRSDQISRGEMHSDVHAECNIRAVA